MCRFQSTPSARRETSYKPSRQGADQYFNPLPPQGGRHPDLSGITATDAISIHSLRKEGDHQRLTATAKIDVQFQSTPSARRETFHSWFFSPFMIYFNPLPPQGGRRFTYSNSHWYGNISIHSLRKEGDGVGGWVGGYLKNISIHSLRKEGDVWAVG